MTALATVTAPGDQLARYAAAFLTTWGPNTRRTYHRTPGRIAPVTTPANSGDQTLLALSILTAWVTEGPDFATRYGLEQMSNADGLITAAPILDMIQGHARLSAVLLHLLADATGRDPLDVLRIAAQELAA